MEVARTSMIHAAAPHFLWPFTVRYAARQLNLWPRVSLPETSPALCWMGKVRDASRFRVWGSRAFVRDTTADKLSSRAIPCVFLGFPPDAPGWQFYHPTSRRVFPSQDVTFDESVPFYRLFPYRTTPLPPFPRSSLLQPVEVSGDSGAAGGGPARGATSGGAEPVGAEPGGAEPERAEPGGTTRERVEPGGAEPRGAEPGGAASGGAEPGGAASAGGLPGACPQWSPQREPLSPQQLREWLARRTSLRSHTRAGGAGAGGTGSKSAGAGGAGAGGTGTRGAGAGGPDAGGTGAGGPGAGGTDAGATGAGGAGAGGAGAGGTDAGATGAGSAGAGGAGAGGTDAGAMELEVLALEALELETLCSSDHPEFDLVRAASLTVTRLLATVVTDPSFKSIAASALVAELVDFAAACRLDYAASLVAESESVCPPSVGGECALGTEDFECLAAAVPHLVAWLLAPEGDPDALDIPTPRSYAEAITGPYSSQWQTAMDAEMASWKSTGTYVDEVPPPGANIVDGMWIFRVKRPSGSPPVFKACYVARGFSQRQGVDFFQTFSPTPKMTTLRVLLHVAAQRDYELHSLDFSTAFLQGSLHEEILLRRPPGFTRSFPPGTQWSLRRPVYGLRQAPREWHDTLMTTLAALGFAPSTTDPSLFLRADTFLPPFYIFVYVDDLVFSTADTEALALVKSELQKRHTCTDLGELRSYLGLQITRDRARRTITLTQSHMVQQVLQYFGFQFSSPQSTPLPTGHSLLAPPSDESVEPSGPYPELVGCLMYLMTCTCPDLAYPLSILARYVAPGRHRREHWEAAKRVLRYLCSTSSMGLVLGGRGDIVLTGHSDASWVDDQATQRSSQGYTFSLGSGSVSWRSTCSSSILSSSCEAEIYAGAMAAQELRWLTYLLTDLGERPRSPPVMYVDNKVAIALCQEHRLEHRTKHIVTSLLESCSSVVSFVLLTWPLGPTLLIYSPRHFRLVIISVSVLR
ncbi:unnamed protein product [Closterium sp. Yama58-4]|nr:unnamed protein product [Closterium sp. Yama58-4]